MDTKAMDGEGLTSLQSFWIRHIRQCEVSANGGVKGYALEHGLEPQDLYRWRSWFRKRGMIPTTTTPVLPTFRSLRVIHQEHEGSGDAGHEFLSAVVIQLPNRIRFEFPGGMEIKSLGALIRQAAGLP